MTIDFDSAKGYSTKNVTTRTPKEHEFALVQSFPQIRSTLERLNAGVAVPPSLKRMFTVGDHTYTLEELFPKTAVWRMLDMKVERYISEGLTRVKTGQFCSDPTAYHVLRVSYSIGFLDIGIAMMQDVRKYALNDWMNREPTKFVDAFYRHRKKVGTMDAASGASHNAHACCNLLILMHFNKRIPYDTIQDIYPTELDAKLTPYRVPLDPIGSFDDPLHPRVGEDSDIIATLLREGLS